MELIDRYLQAIRFWLPRGQKEDIVAELAEDLRAQAEEREAELGRPLNEREVAAILRRCGNPMAVAGRYIPQSPEDPVWAVLYRFVMKVVLLWVLAPIMLIVLIPGLFRGQSIPHAVISAGLAAVQAGVFAIGGVTLGFAIARRLGMKAFSESEWDPLTLPKVVVVLDKRRIPRASSVFEILLGCSVAAWWTDVPPGFPLTWALHRGGIHWTPGAVWEEFHQTCFWPVLFLLAGGVALSVVNFVRPYWTRTRVGVRAAMNATAALLPLYTLALHWEEMRALCSRVAGSHYDATAAERTADALDLTLFLSLGVFVVVCLGTFTYEVVRFLLWKRTLAR
jgi:hypothetical protein